MRRASITQLSRETERLLAVVSRTRRPIVITRYGRPVALLVRVVPVAAPARGRRVRSAR